MNIMKLSRRFLAPAGDEGSADSIDRGDSVEVEVLGAVDDTAVVDTAGAGDEVVETPARDDSGKFAKKGVIPVERHEAVLNKERFAREAAESRAAALEAQIARVDQTADARALDDRIEVLEDQLENARLDGDKDKAKAYAKELRLLEREVAATAQNNVGNQARDQAREEMRLDLTIEKLEAQYPALQDGSESYDQDIVDLVLATQRDLIQRERLAPSRALETAVAKVMAKLSPAVAEKAAGLGAAKEVGDRKKEQVAKNLGVAGKQPASLQDAGIDSDKAGQSKAEGKAEDMTYDEFNALPDAAKARMRGDLV